MSVYANEMNVYRIHQCAHKRYYANQPSGIEIRNRLSTSSKHICLYLYVAGQRKYKKSLFYFIENDLVIQMENKQKRKE